MALSTTIVLLAVVVEQVTNILKSAFPSINGNRAQVASMIIGIFLCLTTRVGLLQELSVPTVFPVVDYLISGLLISRGANFVHEAFHSLSKYNGKKT